MKESDAVIGILVNAMASKIATIYTHADKGAKKHKETCAKNRRKRKTKRKF